MRSQYILGMKIISRDNARSKRLSKFYTGIKCRNNHITERYVSNGKCVSCVVKYNSKLFTKKMKDEKFRELNTERVTKWYSENKEKKQSYDKKYRKEQIHLIRDRKNKWKKKQRVLRTDSAISEILSKRVRNALKAVYVKKVAKTKNLVGCEISFLKKYIETKFKKGMSWKNYGKWQLDHIRPCASFNLQDPAQQKECFHYSNLQPLWAKENREKSDKILK